MSSPPEKPPHTSLITSSNNFQQTGTIDWTVLAAGSLSWSIAVLARLSAARVDPYTTEVARAVCGQFALSNSGSNNVLGAISNLACLKSLGDALWFGFGTKHVARELSTTTQGITCIGLCGMLSECYHEDIAAMIISELVKTFQAPIELTPSILEWKALLHAFAGVLSTTEFPVLADSLMRLDIQHQQFETGVRTGIATPKSISNALKGIGSVSRKEMVSMTIIGGADAGWLAAVCDWLFDLRVKVIDNTGTTRWANYTTNEPSQILIMFAGDANDAHQSTEIYCTGQTYHLQSATDAIINSPHERTVVSGRLKWESVFDSTFGIDFRDLLSTQNLALGSAIGCAARIFSAFSRADNTDIIPDDILRGWSSYIDASHGKGFIHNIVHWFPELASLTNSMERAANSNLETSITQYQSQIALIRGSCKCQNCLSDDDDEESLLDMENYCRVALTETIIVVGHVLSRANVTEGLLLSRTGLERLYFRQIKNSATFHNKTFKEQFGPFARIFVETQTLNDQPLEVALTLFTGHDRINLTPLGPSLGDSKYNSADSALCEAGICAYFDILSEISSSRELCGRIHIIPGRIEYHHKPFESVIDSTEETSFITLAGDIQGPQMQEYLTSLQDFIMSTVVMKESVYALEIRFEISKLGSPGVHLLRPRKTIASVEYARGRVKCGRRKCKLLQGIDESGLTEGNLCLDVHGVEIQVLANCKSLMMCLAIQQLEEAGYECILRDESCMRCCIRHACSIDLGMLNGGTAMRQERVLVIK